MIRVLHIVSGMFLGGAQVMIMNIYRVIDREKIQFDFIVDHPDQQTYFEAEIKELGGRIYRMPRFKGYNIAEICNTWKIFFEEHPEYKILHSHVRSYASIYLPIAKKYGLKTIVHSHSISNGKGFTAIIKKIFQYPIRYQADYFLGCSREAGEWLFGKRIAGSGRYHVLLNGIDVEKFKYNAKAKQKLCKELKIGDKFVFGHVGRFHESKNHMFLLELYKILKIDFPKSKLVLVGDGGLRESIENRIRELDLEADVILTGNRGDVENFYSLFDCLLFPSKWEGFPVTIIEAQAAGLPCFISDTVTKTIKVSEQVTYLSIANGVSIWRNAISNTKFNKREELYQRGVADFDINITTKWITDFYKRIANE